LIFPYTIISYQEELRMLDKTVEKRKEQKRGVSPGLVIATGVVAAGAAIAGAAVWRDKKKRAKIKAVIAQVTKHASRYVQDMQKRVDVVPGEAIETVAKGKKIVKKVVKAAKSIKKHIKQEARNI
jgi:hypothetical protein